MMMSMFSSVSGLKAHQTRMDVIGNNIANVNTVGFKGSRTTFQEIFSQTISGSSAPDTATGRGGTNPMQIGLGMNVDSIDVQMTRGSVQRTESPTDLSIEGEGFFIIRNGDSGVYNFTRAGNFTIDKLGNLVTASGQNVYGWMKYENTDEGAVFDTQEALIPLNLYSDDFIGNKKIMAAKSTESATMAGNLDATKTGIASGLFGADGIPVDGGVAISPHFTTPVTVYDALGNEYTINVNFWKETATGGNTNWHFQMSTTDQATITDGIGTFQFDSNGKIVSSPDNTPTVTFTPDDEVGAAEFGVTFDFNKLSMYADDSSVKPTVVDGYPPGTLVTFSVGNDGILTGSYDNGRQMALGLVALATFDNPAGLQKVGSNQFIATTNSGDFRVGQKPGTGDAGSLIPGTLEMSNVDLANQFTEMIITQRGFQANSRVMTTSDEILQELANMKR